MIIIVWIEQVIAADAASRPVWQSIETAPRDGTIVIVRGRWGRLEPEMRAASARFETHYGIAAWWRDNGGYGFTVECDPTHWMPEPPA